MKKLKAGFLWHMHQPYYLDETSGEFMLPWVRLHSLRGYYDMAKILEDHPKMKVNFNYVPGLLLQIEKYIDGTHTDKYFKLSLKSPSDLTDDEKIFILSKFFMINWSAVVHRYPRYNELLSKRGYTVNKDILREALNIFTNQDFMDLQVWFNLAWFGFKLKKEEPFLQELIRKDRMFGQEEKEKLLLLQLDVLKRIIPMYKALQDKGQIEISVSPFYHPILPLVYDNKSALECMPKAVLPADNFSSPEDTNKQILKAGQFYQERFGAPVRGMWPSEGSVSPDVVRLFAENDVKWVATDEQILFNSLEMAGDRSRVLYKPYQMSFQGRDISIFFRDHNLSDNIGFKYAKMPAKDAAQELHQHFKNIYNYVKADNKDYIVSIILDGENPWEYYDDSGEEFLNLVYSKIENDNDLESVTFSDYINQYDNQAALKKIYTGSWINHDFGIWIGGKEENKGWSLLARTRRFLEEFIREHPGYDSGRLSLAWEEMYQAEGSDWFWWYGDNFTTENDEEFDMLFRKHLKNIYLLLAASAPEELNIPISEKAKVINVSQPKAVLHPLVDGVVNNYFEWWGAGKYMPSLGQTMARNTRAAIREVDYGYNNDNLFFRIDFEDPEKVFHNGKLKVKINFIRPERNKIIFELSRQTGHFSIISSDDNRELSQLKSIGIKEIVELCIPFKELNINYKDEVYFFMELIEGDKVIETIPYDSYIYFKAPPENFKSLMWME
ncbi:MAG: glycoside hydrolase family 57 protein [bacterium]|nr:glycoside hydrolase family 57 protein [bacterium]